MAHGEARTPPEQPDVVPIDVEAFEDLGDGSFRLQFLTVADDGLSTRFNEEVFPVGDPETWLVAFLGQHQIDRARMNSEAIEKAALRNVPPTVRVGTEDSSMRARVDDMFPTQQR